MGAEIDQAPQETTFGGRFVKHRRGVIAFTVLITLISFLTVFRVGLDGVQTRLTIDPTVDRLIDGDSPERLFQVAVKRLFGEAQVVIVAVGRADYRSEDGLGEVRAIQDVLARRSEIQKVDSLASVVHAKLTDDGFVELEKYANFPLESAQQVLDFQEALVSNPLVDGRLISKDGQVVAFVLHFNGDPAPYFASADYIPSIKQAIADVAPGRSVWMTGSEIVKAGVSRAVSEQFAFLVPVVLILTGLITVIAFRSLVGAALTLLLVSTALLWTLAVVVAFGTPLTLVSAIMPPVVVILGLAYAMHAQSDYLGRLRRYEARDLLSNTAATIDSLRLPLLLTGATTIAGFLALTLNPLQTVREFALYSALGVAIDVFLALCVLPLLLAIFKCRSTRVDGSETFDRVAGVFAQFALRHRRAILLTGAGVLVLGVVSLTRLETGTNYVRSFAPDHPVRVDFEEINQSLSGINSFSIVLEGFVDGTFTEPEVLQSVYRLQAWLERQPEIGATESVVDHLMLVQQGFGETVDPADPVPSSAAAIKQLLLFGANSAMHSVVDKRFSTARILVYSYEENSAVIRDLLERLRPQLAKLPRRLEVSVTGDSVLLTETVGHIAAGQWASVGIATLAMYLLLAALFTSWTVAAAAMLPNLMPVAVYYGLLGMFGIPLSPTTSLIACIVLGVAVDDTIHFLVRFNTASRQLADQKKAVSVALRGVLRPVTFTTVALCAGFSVMMLSPLQNQAQFGLLASATLAIAWVFDVIFTPALGSGVRLVTLWDVLRLDLGEDPEKSIPLFAGLSSRQARTFALMSRVQSFPKGARIISEGDDAKDIFVIIDGRLRAFLDREDGETELSVMDRGTVMGEVGYFGQKRSASVEAMTPARLLAFNGADLDAMRRRFPRIAATVFRNLNLAQAERLANMARMI